jgi:hypothetical protein
MAQVPTKVYAKDRDLFERLKTLPRKELLDTHVTTVPFCVRAQNGFVKKGTETLRHLIQRRKFDLLKQQNMGRKTVEQVEAYLKELGLHLDTPAFLVETGFIQEEEFATVEDLDLIAEPLVPLLADSDLERTSEDTDLLGAEASQKEKLVSLAGRMRSILSEIEEVLR